jgi:hypothetical protein
VTRTGIIAAAFALAAIVLVAVVAQDMRGAGFVVRAYVVTAAILAVYTWSLARRLSRAQQGESAAAQQPPSSDRDRGAQPPGEPGR